MAIREESTLVSFDAEAALATAEDVTESVLSCIEFTSEDWHTIYASDQVVAMYEDREHMDRHFESIASHMDVDLNERDLFERELSAVGPVQYFVTYMDNAAFVRVVTESPDGQYEGLWLTYPPNVPFLESVEAVSDRIGRSSGRSSPYE